MICERMLREQEVALRSEYESALSTKLAEQYEAFVRFNLDQVCLFLHITYYLRFSTASSCILIQTVACVYHNLKKE